jgi:hypothetical protein
MSSIERNHPYLSFLAVAPANQRKEILRTSSNGQIQCLCECAYNILQGQVPTSPQHKRELKKYRKLIYTLVDKRVPYTKKKSQLQQSGGFLPALIAPVVAALVAGIVDRYGK